LSSPAESPASTARGTEMLMPLWLSIMRKLGGGDFNFAIARA
jgi:hypothetical protein